MPNNVILWLVIEMKLKEYRITLGISAKESSKICSVPLRTYIRYENDDSSGIDIIKNFSDIGEKSGCEIPQDIAKYFDNLVRLGLIISADGLSSLTDKAQYDPLKNHRWVKPHATTEKANSRSFTKYNFNESFVEITAYGKSFCSICLETQKVIILKSQEG